MQAIFGIKIYADTTKVKDRPRALNTVLMYFILIYMSSWRDGRVSVSESAETVRVKATRIPSGLKELSLRHLGVTFSVEEGFDLTTIEPLPSSTLFVSLCLH